jgi:hypothetical protein
MQSETGFTPWGDNERRFCRVEVSRVFRVSVVNLLRL